jgi:hypothetical protein
MTHDAAAGAFAAELGRVEALVGEIEAVADEAVREKARALVQAVLALHAEGLRRLLSLAGPDSAARFAAADELVGSLLLLHDLHPDVETPARQALRAADRPPPAPRVDFVPLARLQPGGSR